jgi:uncharacterized protein (TIGR02231 family)
MTMHTFRAGALAGASVVVLLIALGSASAAELALASKIASVTVYPHGATVVRTAPLTLPAGSSTIVLNDLPIELRPESLKVEGMGDKAIAIASVETRLEPADPDADPKRVAIVDDIESLDDRLGAIADRIAALDGRRRFLERLIDATPDGFGKALAEGNANVEQWGTAAATIGAGLAAVADEMRAARIEERALTREREDLEEALAELPEPVEHRSVRISVASDAAASGSLSISYDVTSARWLPTYDAHLTTGEANAEPSLAIVRRAEVTQQTGENWDGVVLSLSTAQITGGTEAPTLTPFLVTLYDQDAYRQRDSAAKSLMMPAPTAGSAMNAEEAAPGAPPLPARFIEATADFGDFRAVYRVPGAVSVESGEGARSLQIATEKAAAKLAVRAVPLVSDTAYVQVAFTPSAGAPLLGGKIALFRDGTFVGNGELPFTSAGKEIDLGFGVDDRVKVTRAVLDRQSGEQGIFAGRKTDLRRYKITVENLHKRPIDITILDRVPYAEDEKVSVERLRDMTEPTETNVDDNRGVLAWTYAYAPGEQREILNGYEVSWPSGQSLVSLD